MLSKIDWLSKQDIIGKINELDLFMERIRDEVYENNCESNKKWLEELKERRNELIEKRENIKND